MHTSNYPNIKICGITQAHTARFVAEHGIGAIGFVFYKKSPRYITPAQADSLSQEVKQYDTARVGVFVNAAIDEIVETAKTAQLTTIQLHGDETPEYIRRLTHTGCRIIKVLKTTGKALANQALQIPDNIGIMVEASNGSLPGGNGALWDWKTAYELSKTRPIAIAGGITPDNILKASEESGAIALDISSGVEDTTPGIKSHAKISELIKKLSSLSHTGGVPHIMVHPTLKEKLWHIHH